MRSATVSVVIADPLRDRDAEAALTAAYIRQPAWLDSHAVALDVLTAYEARAVLRALLGLRRAGSLASNEKLRRAQIAQRSGIALSVLKRMDEECWDGDVPQLARYLRDLHARRALLLVGEAAVSFAHDSARNVAASVARVRAVLDQVVA